MAYPYEDQLLRTRLEIGSAMGRLFASAMDESIQTTMDSMALVDFTPKPWMSEGKVIIQDIENEATTDILLSLIADTARELH